MFTIDTTTNNGVVLHYPSTNDGYYYFFIGFGRTTYAATATKYLTINQTHPIFYYNNGLKVYAPKDLTSSDVTTALGYTPYSAANPSGYTSNKGTVTSVGTGTGLSISGSASVTPTVNIASGYKLPTTTEWNSKANTSAVEAKQDQITVESGGSYQTISYEITDPSGQGDPYVTSGTVYIQLPDTYSKVQFVNMSAGGGDQYEVFRNSDSSPVVLSQGSSVTLQDQEGYSGGSSCTFTLNGNVIETTFSSNDFSGISVSDLKQVDSKFHAQKSAKKRHYRYEFINRKCKNAFDGDLLRVKFDINLKRMQESLNYLLGEHDFSSFKSSGTLNPSKVCFIYEAKVQKVGDKVIIDIVGNRFLYNMVRTIVGTLLEIEGHNLPAVHMKEVLEALNRRKAGATISPFGLTLVKVEY
jgi:tRNA pseudouridine(38-40) synthase